MASEFSDFHEASLQEVISLLGTSIVHNGKNYSGIINSIELSSDFRDGGLLEQIDTVIIVLKSDFTTAPKAGQTVVADGKIVRIQKVDCDEISYEMRCITAARA